MLAFSNDYYGFIFRATQSVELFCAYADKIKCIALYCYIANKKKVDRKVLAQKFGVSTLDIRFAYLLGKIIHVKMKYRR